MRTASSVVRAALAAAVVATAVTGCAFREPVELPEPDSFARQVFDEINELRRNQSVAMLTWDDCLAGQATERAERLPGAESVPRDDLDAECGNWDYAGENMSRADVLPGEVVSTWAEQDTQYPNLVDPLFVVAGVGCAGVAFDDTGRVAEPGEELAGMGCSVIFMGHSE